MIKKFIKKIWSLFKISEKEVARNWKVYTYSAGTNSPVETYTDKCLTVCNTNPVILDYNGNANIYLKEPTDMVWQENNGPLILVRDVTDKAPQINVIKSINPDEGPTIQLIYHK